MKEIEKDLKSEEKILKEKEITRRKTLMEEEDFIRNLKANKDDLLIDIEYHSDDLERGVFKKIRSHNSDFINPDDIMFSTNVRFKRLMIEFTLITLLISIIFLFGYFFLIKRSLFDIMIILQSQTMHFRSYFICVYGNWLIISSNLNTKIYKNF